MLISCPLSGSSGCAKVPWAAQVITAANATKPAAKPKNKLHIR
jgi:hypothetical protein